jgi:hypothetical protein
MDGMISHIEELLKDKNMLCKICGTEGTDNPVGSVMIASFELWIIRIFNRTCNFSSIKINIHYLRIYKGLVVEMKPV